MEVESGLPSLLRSALALAFAAALFKTREARQAGRGKPRRGGAQGCAPFSEQQDAASENSRPACEPNGFIVGRAVRVCFFGYFLCTSKESNSRESAKSFNYQITGDNSGLREKRPQPLEAASIPQAGEGRKEMR